jgi:threonine aldolase
MRSAMAAADVGDDVYGEDPTVNALEARVASLFGHEAGMFVPTGSMGNQTAIQTLVDRGGELLCDADAHVVTYEIGAAAALGGISTRTWPASGAAVSPETVAAMVRPDGYHAVATRAIAVEQTHNRAGGAVIPLATLQALRAVADEGGLLLHCDGARIWNAHVADEVPLATYGALFDTMSVCLSKGLGAPIGSVLVSTAGRVAAARVIRKRLGGGMRQAGVLAAAGLYALDHHVARLADDHARARRLAEALAPFGVVDPATVRTNIVLLDFAKSTVDVPTFAARARAEGVLVSVLGPALGRLITHLDVTDDDIDRAAQVLPAILS